MWNCYHAPRFSISSTVNLHLLPMVSIYICVLLWQLRIDIVYGESVWITLIIGKENSWLVTVPRSLLWDIFVVYKQQTSRQGLGHTRHHMAAPCSLFCRLTIPILRRWCRARDPNYSYQYQADNWQWLCNNLTSFCPTRVPFSLS